MDVFLCHFKGTQKKYIYDLKWLENDGVKISILLVIIYNNNFTSRVGMHYYYDSKNTNAQKYTNLRNNSQSYTRLVKLF